MSRSRNSSPDLDFVHFWQPFVRIFQFFSIAHYGLLRLKTSKNYRFKLFLSRSYIVFIILIRLIVAYFYAKLSLPTRYVEMKKYSVSPVFVGVNGVTKFILVLPFIVIPIETFFKRRTERAIFETLQHIDDMFKKNLKHSIDYRTHRRRQLRKIWLYLAGVTFVIFSSVSINISILNPKYSHGVLIFVYIFAAMLIRVFQFTFFINELTDLLGELRIVMQRQQQRAKYNPTRWKDIQFVRKVYSKIWFLRKLIGECFGYSMILFVVDSAVKVIDSAYWFYLNNESLKSISLHIGQYIVVYIHLVYPRLSHTNPNFRNLLCTIAQVCFSSSCRLW